MTLVTDQFGRSVELTSGAWHQIVARYSEMAPYRADVLETVRAPDHHGSDPIEGRERY